LGRRKWEHPTTEAEKRTNSFVKPGVRTVGGAGREGQKRITKKNEGTGKSVLRGGGEKRTP